MHSKADCGSEATQSHGAMLGGLLPGTCEGLWAPIFSLLLPGGVFFSMEA